MEEEFIRLQGWWDIYVYSDRYIEGRKMMKDKRTLRLKYVCTIDKKKKVSVHWMRETL